MSLPKLSLPKPSPLNAPQIETSPPRVRMPELTRTRSRRLFGDDTGAATAEYASATRAAVGFAGLVVVIMRSDEVRGILTDLVRRALTVA
jgi:hypothetical protein